jgi:hypothetical protein
MRTLLCGAAAIMSKLGLNALCLVAAFARFRHRDPGYSAFFANHHREFAVVITSVPLNAGINGRYLSGRTLE